MSVIVDIDAVKGRAAMAPITTPGQLGQAVRATRRRAGFTQQELADAAGVSRSWLVRFEQGHRSARLDQILLVLRELGIGLQLVEDRLRPRDQEILDAVIRAGGPGASVDAGPVGT